jgi:hypothetical protein
MVLPPQHNVVSFDIAMDHAEPVNGLHNAHEVEPHALHAIF